MLKLTFGDVKEELRRVAGQTSVQVEDPRLVAYTDLAQERLCSMGEWPFQYARIKFQQYEGLVSLPSEYEAIVHSAIDRENAVLQSSWYEFIGGGPGHQDKKGWVNAGIDRGESPVFRQPGIPGYRLKVISLADERVNGVRPKITVFGYDEGGAWVRTSRNGVLADGADYELAGDATENWALTSQKWTKIIQVSKPITNGEVAINYVDQHDREFDCARYSFRDKNPTYRQYYFPVIRPGNYALVHAVVRRRLFPILADSDPLMVNSLGALRLGVKAIALEDAGDVANSQLALASAVSLLKEQTRLYRATTGRPQMDVSPVAAFGAADWIY